MSDSKLHTGTVTHAYTLTPTSDASLVIPGGHPGRAGGVSDAGNTPVQAGSCCMQGRGSRLSSAGVLTRGTIAQAGDTRCSAAASQRSGAMPRRLFCCTEGAVGSLCACVGSTDQSSKAGRATHVCLGQPELLVERVVLHAQRASHHKPLRTAKCR